MSKYLFKKLLKKKINDAAMKYLNELKEKHTKMENIQSKELICSEYLKDTRLSKTETKLLFKFRTRMYSVKANFSKKYENSNLLCELCVSAKCTQEHLFKCPVLSGFIPELKTSAVKYDYIFGNIKEMKKIVIVLKKICDIRQNLLEDIQ